MSETFFARLRRNPFAGENSHEHPDLSRIPAILLGFGLLQAIAMVGSTAMFLVGSILVVELAHGDTRLAGVPTAIVLVASALSSYPLARLKSRMGYRPVLVLAGLCGALAGGVAILGTIAQSIPAILGACALVGFANGAILLSRYGAAELAPAGGRGKALSVVMTSSMIGALVAPALSNTALTLAATQGVRKEIGAFALLAAAYLVAGLVGRILISREPSHIAAVAAWKPAQAAVGPKFHQGTGGRLAVTIGALVFGQVAMVFLMSITPAHMKHCHHGMGEITTVITMHFLGMYGVSPLTGFLVDRIGRIRVIAAGSATLAASCLIGLLWTSLAARLASLFLLGLGWNFCFLAGSVLVADSLRAGNMARLQGGTDALVSLSSAVASILAGLALQAYGFGTLSAIGIGISLVPLVFLAVGRVRSGGPGAVAA